MDPIEELRKEHDAVRTALGILNRIIQETQRTQKIPDPDHLTQLLNFFSRFVDQCHHAKEEDLLFPAMEAIGVSRQGGPIGVMLNEHQQGREHVTGMKIALVAYLDGKPGAAPALAERARAYIDLLRHHIDKENNVLFPMASRHLTTTTLAELKSGFDRIETQRVGAGTHEAFHHMLDDLRDVYVKTVQ